MGYQAIKQQQDSAVWPDDVLIMVLISDSPSSLNLLIVDLNNKRSTNTFLHFSFYDLHIINSETHHSSSHRVPEHQV